MKQKNIDTWKGIRSMGKWRFVFVFCCVFYCLVSIVSTLRRLWPDGEFINFGGYLTKVIILFVGGFLIALLAWNNNENKFRKAMETETKNV